MRASRLPLPPEPIEVEIGSVDERGRGLAEADGRRLRVPGTLPGERVRVRYRRRRKRDDEGALVDVLAPAPGRAAPPCPHFLDCGGCDWQHLEADARLGAQAAEVAAALAAAGAAPERIAPAVRGPRLGYRRKARLGVRFVPGKGGALVGFREKFGNRVAVLDSCAVLHPVLGERIGALRALIDSLDARERIPQIEFAAGDARAVLVFRHLGPLGAADAARLRRFADATGLGVAVQPDGPESVAPLAGGGLDLSYRLEGFGLDFGFHPLDFVQVNAAVNAALVARAVEELRPAGRVLDLFCGLGNFTLAIASRGAAVIGVEGEPRLVERARENARRNGLDRAARFESADLARPDALAPFLADGVDRLLLDPPRSGAAQVLRSLAGSGRRPERIVYVSCHPGTLARDSGWLVRSLGYRLRTVAIADMFPHTSHVEAVATLERGPPPAASPAPRAPSRR